MTMFFMNLDKLPDGKNMYTVFVTYDPEGEVETADEVDFVLPDWFTADQIKEHVRTELDSDCYEGARIIAIANQSRGDGFMWKETGVQ